MFPAKSVLTLLTVWLSATVCLAEDPSFPQPAKGVELVKDQYIVQFKGDTDFEQARNSILKNDEVNFVRYIDTRSIGVFKFSSENAAAKWRDGAVGVKYFEQGEKCVVYTFTQNTREDSPLEYDLHHGFEKSSGGGGGGHVLKSVDDCAAFRIHWFVHHL